MTNKVRVGVIGATGYAGSELLRILALHEEVQVTYAAISSSESPDVFTSMPYLPHFRNLALSMYDFNTCVNSCDAIFVALPSGASGSIACQLKEAGRRVIDLSGDLRLPRPLYEAWYPHNALAEDPRDIGVVYGLTEWYRPSIQGAHFVSNPGCFATAALLGLIPAIKARFVDTTRPLVIDAKSGVSGAGRKPLAHLHLGELSENMFAYKVGQHQHTPEVAYQLGLDANQVIMTTQLLPTIRGIYVSSYVSLSQPIHTSEVFNLYQETYAQEPFIFVHHPGELPQMKHVKGSNRCHIGLYVHEPTQTLQVFSTIDNLQKGAAGQAVQNLNVMYGFEETKSLLTQPMYP